MTFLARNVEPGYFLSDQKNKTETFALFSNLDGNVHKTDTNHGYKVCILKIKKDSGRKHAPFEINWSTSVKILSAL